MLAELLRTTRILNVDDDESSRYVTSRLLRSAGFDVFEAGSGEEALALIATERPDLVVLDVNLPGMNGFEVCRRLRSDPRTEHVPIVHLTATARDAESAVTGLDSGADAYLSQPVERSVLLATVRAILRARRAEAQLAEAANHWRTTFDTIGDPICVVDPLGVILRANLAFAALTGRPVETVVGMNAGDVLPNLWQEPNGSPPDGDVIGIGSRWFRRTEYPITDGAVPAWSTQQVVLLTDVTEQKRADEERAWLLERERSARTAAEQARSDLWFLALASEMLSESLDQETILHTLATILTPRLGEGCAVFLVEDEHASSAANTGGVETPVEAPEGVQDVIESARGTTQTVVASEGTKQHVLIVPLAARGSVLGALWLARRDPAAPYTDSDMALVSDCARRAALAIDNARLYEERKRVAALLQQGLLPADLPEIPGVSLAARFRSGSLETHIGGDFYDVFSIGDGRWAAVIGDVQGRGVRAASLTALARHTVKTAALVVREPTAIVRLLNEAVGSDGASSPDSPFLSTVYAEIEPHEDGFRMRVVCAGHPLPLLIHADGRVDFAGRPGTVVGPFDQPTLEETTIDVRPGETVLLYTDGVTEARANNELFGEERLIDLVSRRRDADLETLVHEIEQASIRFASGGGHDDIAILALRAD